MRQVAAGMEKTGLGDWFERMGKEKVFGEGRHQVDGA